MISPRCLHGNVSTLENNMTVDYNGALNQVLLDVSDWVERGIEPLPSTVYRRDGGQIIPAETAAERKQEQPQKEHHYTEYERDLVREKLIFQCVREGNLNYREISEKMQFGTRNYFSRVFRDKEGMTPQEYLDRAKNIRRTEKADRE